MKKNAIKIEFALKDGILGKAKEAVRLASRGTNAVKATNKVLDQYNAIKKSKEQLEKDNTQILNKMVYNGSIDADYKKLLGQLKSLGLNEGAIPDVVEAIKAVETSGFYKIEQDLKDYTKMLAKIK